MPQPAKEIIKHWLDRQEAGTQFTVKNIRFDLFHNAFSWEAVRNAIKQLGDSGHVELTEMRIGQSPVWTVLKGKENELSE